MMLSEDTRAATRMSEGTAETFASCLTTTVLVILMIAGGLLATMVGWIG